jgi:ribosomal protein S18 acetylase RimI-like enzyme
VSDHISVRDATPDDTTSLLRLLAQLGTGAEPPDPERSHQALARILGREDHAVLLAEDHGAPVGSVHVVVVLNLTHDGAPWAIIENLIVDERSRRGGVGRALIEEVVRRARARGCYKIQFLSAAHRAGAHAFYESLGFEPSARGYRLYF